jgi:hypothetical protein
MLRAELLGRRACIPDTIVMSRRSVIDRGRLVLRVTCLPRLLTIDEHAPPVLCIKWMCQGGARPLRRSYLDQQ